MNLQVKLFPDITLQHPLGLSSSHLTGDEKSLERVLAERPSFVTLKSTSDKFGGQGKGKRVLQRIDRFGVPFTIVSDGPRQLELLTSKRTIELVHFVRSIYPNIVLGASVLYDEALQKILPIIEQEGVDYFELNFKYFMRDWTTAFDSNPAKAMRHSFDEVLTIVEKALHHTHLPILLKFSGDVFWLTSTKYLQKLAKTIAGYHVALILTNSKRWIIPTAMDKFLTDDIKAKTAFRAVSGSALLPETLTLVNKVSQIVKTPIIACGGILDGHHVIASILLGATAVQVCTAPTVRGISCISDIRQEIADLLKSQNIMELGSLKRFAFFVDPVKYVP